MRNNIYYLMILFFLTGSCDTATIDSLFVETPEERMQEELTQVKDRLISSKNGWISSFKYNNFQNEDYFLVKFMENNRAVITFGDGKNEITHETTYSLRYGQQVNLIFDLYSIFSDIVSLGGDFRFVLKEIDDNSIVWSTRNGPYEGEGELTISSCEEEDSYDKILNIRHRVANDNNRSFYRILMIDGNETKFSFNYQTIASFEWLQDNKIEQTKSRIEINEEGFVLESPFNANGTLITHFIYNEIGDYFDAYDTNGKVGILKYTDKKPFSYPNVMNDFMATIGASYSNLVIVPIAYTNKFAETIKNIKNQEEDFLWMQIQVYNSMFIYIFKDYYKTCFYRLESQCYEDEIKMEMSGIAQNEPSRELYPLIKPNLDMLTGTYSIIPRDGRFYFVKNEDPSVSFIAKAQVKDSF